MNNRQLIVKNTIYTKEELELLDYIENENPDSIFDMNNTIKQLKLAIKDKRN